MKVNYFVSHLEQYLSIQEGKLESCSDSKREFLKEVISPCGKYKLEIYKIIKENKWDYSNGVITRLKDNKELCSITRNISSFYYYFVGDYLICGENYQGYSVINLETETSNVYFPEAGFKGGGFCWSSIVGLVNNKLLVDGCYWGGLYEVVIYDFTNPEVLPLPELKRLPNDDKVVLEGNVLTVQEDVDYRISDGALYDDLSEEEQEVLDNNFVKLCTSKLIARIEIL